MSLWHSLMTAVWRYYATLTALRPCVPFLILSLALTSPRVVAQTAVETPRTIRVVMDNAYAPYAFQSNEGRLQGILVDQWKEWEKKTGIKAELSAMDWGEALQRMRAGEFDVIDCIVETAERRDYFDFTPAYATIEASIFFRNEIAGITDLGSLQGFPVGVKVGDQHIDRLKENGVSTVILFQNNDAIVEAAKQHKINVFIVDSLSALYLLNKMGVEADFRRSAPIFRDGLRRAVRKGDASLLRTVSEGFAAIEPGTLKQIDEKWFGRTINGYGRYLAYAGYAAAVAILLIASLVSWNRALRKRILQRTAALSESEQRFHQIAENIHEVFWLIDMVRETMLYVSPAYEAVWGRSRESLYREPGAFFTAIHPEDSPRVAAAIERNRKQGFEVEYRMVRPDGSIRWIWNRGVPIKDESGRFYRLAGIAEDITERKQAGERLKHSEAQLAEAQRLAHVGYWERSLDTGEITGSDETYRIFGLQPHEPIENFDELIHPEDRPVHAEATARALRGEPYDVEYRVVRPDGDVKIVHSHGQAVCDEAGRPRRAVGAVQDVTELKRAEETLKATSEQLRALSARLQSVREEEATRIAREVHDELGQTLTAVKLELTTLLGDLPADEGPTPQRRRSIVKLLDEGIQSIRRIAAELRPGILDDLGLPAAVEWVAQEFEARTGTTVQVSLPPIDIAMDRRRVTALFRILQETLTNVARHADATQVDVRLGTENGDLALEVRDNGKGISQQQLSANTSLGILGMRERVLLLGGTLTISGTPGKGTTVRVLLPDSRQVAE
jgi:PAS domain S-box-containing protein